MIMLKSVARIGYENILYLEVQVVTYVWVTKKSRKRGYSNGNFYSSFQGRVVEDSEKVKGESLLSSTPVVVLSTILGRTPTMEEYKAA
jgi:aconitate hydratase 2/2-methylisocitrate dehydratase